MPVTYTAFGGVKVAVDGHPVPITRARERQVMASLIASREVPVSADRLAQEVWGANAKPSTLSLVQVAVSRLRSLLEPDRPQRRGQRIVSTAAGYVLRAEAEDVDVWRFEDLAGRALAADRSPAEVLGLCTEASALWAPPYAAIEVPGPRRHADRLVALHTDLLIEQGRALLDLDRADTAVRLLAGAAEEDPFREPLWCLLTLARYRSGRQGDALATIRQLRAAMAEELGVDPTATTLALEQAILRQDPTLLTHALLALTQLRGEALPLGTVGEAPHGEGTRVLGRGIEITAGIGLLDEARTEGRSRTLLVAGEGGVGKSTYLARLAELAAERGFEVLIGRNHQDDLAPALWPWIEIVRPLLDEATASVQETLRPLVAAEAPAHDSVGRALATYDAILDLLLARAANRQVLLVIEDVHWADTATLRMLRHLAHARPAVPLVVAVSRRTPDTPSAPLLDALAELSRAGVARVRLDGLPSAAVGELLDTVVGTHSDQLAGFVTKLTGGNPFFVLQYAGLLAGDPGLVEHDPATLEIPEGIRDVLRQRLHTLPESASAAVVSASVLGQAIDPDVLAALVDKPIGEVIAALDLAVTSGLIVEDGTNYAFVHALARDTAYGELTAARRIRMHDQAGRVIEDRRGTRADWVSAIARHTWAASSLSPEHGERAVRWRIRAATQAQSRHAHDEAMELWRSVQPLLPEGTEAAARGHGGVAIALIHLSRIGEAAREIEQGLLIARDLGAWELAAELVITLAEAGPWAWPNHDRSRAGFVEALTETIPRVGDADRAMLLAIMEVELYVSAEAPRRGNFAPESLALVRTIEDDALRLRVLLFLLVGTTGIWSAKVRLELAHELMALHPHDELLVGALQALAVIEWENLHPDAADDAMERCAQAAEQLRVGASDLPLAYWRAMRARDRDSPDALALTDAVTAMYLRSGAALGHDAQWLSAIYRGEDVIRDRLATAGWPMSPTIRAMVAFALLEIGEAESALIGLRGLPPGAADISNLVGRCFRMPLLARFGPADQLHELVENLESHRGETLTVFAIADHCGVVDYFLAVGYGAVGDPRALDTARAALLANETLGALPWIRRSRTLVDSLV